MKTPIILLLTLFINTIVCSQSLQFFAPAQPSGSIKVKLYAVGGVTIGQQHLVTIGVPMPRGSLSMAALNTVRVLKNNVEVPAYVSQLTPWRSITNATVDGQSVRVMQVQIHNTFQQLYPAYDSVNIEWGNTSRQQHLSWADPASAKHLVTSGSFAAADSVYEPDVIATLPKEFLAKGVLKTRMEPFEPAVSDTIEDAATIEAINNWPNHTDMDHGMHNFFYTLINEGTPISNTYAIQYKTDAEPWLYDRASSMYMVYLRSGNVKHLREAIRNAEFYRRNLHPNGIFKLKQPTPNFCTGGNDAMYSVNECLAYSYWFTGDTSLPGWIRKIANIHEQCGAPYQWSPSASTWTERHNSFRLLANVIAYEVSGENTFRDRLNSMVAAFRWHQDGAGGQLSMPRVDGALYHTKGQHGEGAVESDYIASNWMSVLMTDAMIRAYSQTESSDIENFIIRMAHFQRKSAKNHTTGLPYAGAGNLWSIDYLVNVNGTTNVFNGDEYNHSMEVAAAIAWGGWFAKKSGQPYDSLMRMADTLYRTYSIGLDEYIRPGNIAVNAPVFRITPPRMYGWQYRPSASFSWLMKEMKTSIVLPVKLISFTGNRNGNVNNLYWRVEDDKDIDFFTVQKSKDGITFLHAGIVNSNANGTTHFSFADMNTATATQFYRLRITERNGHITYSNIIILDAGGSTDIVISPNPATDKICIAGSRNSREQAIIINLFDVTGKLVLSQKMITAGPGNICMPVQLQNGVYTVLVQDLAGTILNPAKKVVVAR